MRSFQFDTLKLSSGLFLVSLSISFGVVTYDTHKIFRSGRTEIVIRRFVSYFSNENISSERMLFYKSNLVKISLGLFFTSLFTGSIGVPLILSSINN